MVCLHTNMHKTTTSQKRQQAKHSAVLFSYKICFVVERQHTDKGPHIAHAKPDSQQIHRDTTHSSQTSVIIDK